MPVIGEWTCLFLPTALCILFQSKHKLRSKEGRILFPDTNASIVSLPEIPPYPEPLHDWYESPQVTETLEGFDTFLAQSWTERVEELQE